MSSRFQAISGTVAIAALLSLCSPAFAQSEDAEMRIERLENQLRQLTGQNEELQYRNRQLEERLRALEAKPVRREGMQEGRWVLLDYGEIVVHVQHAEERVFYALERLWKDCPVIALPAEVTASNGRRHEFDDDAESAVASGS
jgi:TolA-binding protein